MMFLRCFKLYVALSIVCLSGLSCDSTAKQSLVVESYVPVISFCKEAVDKEVSLTLEEYDGRLKAKYVEWGFSTSPLKDVPGMYVLKSKSIRSVRMTSIVDRIFKRCGRFIANNVNANEVFKLDKIREHIEVVNRDTEGEIVFISGNWDDATIYYREEQ